MIDLLLLGSGGWIPTSARATCSALIRSNDHAILIDAGTGIGRLVEEPSLLRGSKHLDIILTHFHLDHVVGLGYLPALDLAERARLIGPGTLLYGTPTTEILARLIAPPLFGSELEEVVAGVDEINDPALPLGPCALQFRVQERHTDPTLAIRIGDELTYCTDTAYDEGNVEFARGSRILAHEAWCTEDDPRDLDTHSSARQAADIARNAGVGELVLIHIRPGADESRLTEEANSAFAPVRAGRDLMALG